MIIKDDRTEEQKQTHKWLVIGTDSFMSGWGEAKAGASYAAWACLEKDLNRMEDRISGRKEMKRVRVIYGDYRPNPQLCAHLHIYVANL